MRQDGERRHLRIKQPLNDEEENFASTARVGGNEFYQALNDEEADTLQASPACIAPLPVARGAIRVQLSLQLTTIKQPLNDEEENFDSTARVGDNEFYQSLNDEEENFDFTARVEDKEFYERAHLKSGEIKLALCAKMEKTKIFASINPSRRGSPRRRGREHRKLHRKSGR